LKVLNILGNLEAIKQAVMNMDGHGIVRRPALSVILPNVMRGEQSSLRNFRACEMEVKSSHGKTE
jgi:hypothetical protein